MKKQTEDAFVRTLQDLAKRQASISGSSPLPEWLRPLASLVGLHYWQILLCVSFVLALVIAFWTFPAVYLRVIGVL